MSAGGKAVAWHVMYVSLTNLTLRYTTSGGPGLASVRALALSEFSRSQLCVIMLTNST